MQDAANNNYPASNDLNVWIGVGPQVASITHVGPIIESGDVTITFSDAVRGFSAGELEIENGRASSLRANSPTEYLVTITPGADGDVMVTVPAGAAQSVTEGYGNQRSTMETFQGYVASPVTITGPSGTVNGDFAVTITFADAGGVTGLEATEIVVSSNATVANLTGAGRMYTATIVPSADGTVTVSLPADVAVDLGGVGNRASNTYRVTVDRTAPTAGRVRLNVSPSRITEDAGPIYRHSHGDGSGRSLYARADSDRERPRLRPIGRGRI